MKISIIIFAIVFIQAHHTIDNSGDSQLGYKLVVDVENIKSIITEVKDGQRLQDWTRAVIVLRVKKYDGIYELRSAKLYKIDFGWYLRDKKDSLYGYFEYKGITVLVYGDDADSFFSKTDHLKKFDFLRIRPREKPEEQFWPDLEIIFEPDVWVYNYIDGDFIFIDRDFYNPIE